MNEKLKMGDYVLATKYHDGSPLDNFAIGFYSGIVPLTKRYLVIDEDGKYLRRSGFRRVEKITESEGQQLLSLFPDISDKHGPTLWSYLKRIRKQNMV